MYMYINVYMYKLYCETLPRKKWRKGGGKSEKREQKQEGRGRKKEKKAKEGKFNHYQITYGDSTVEVGARALDLAECAIGDVLWLKAIGVQKSGRHPPPLWESVQR